MQVNFLMAGCCLEHYNPETGACSVCHFCYSQAAWTAYLLRIAEASAPIRETQAQAEAARPISETQIETPTFPVPVTPPRVAVNPIVGDRRCSRCDLEFAHRRKTAEFCSTACRVAAHRERKARELDCPRCGLKAENGKLAEHSCAKEIALDRIFSYRH